MGTYPTFNAEGAKRRAAWGSLSLYVLCSMACSSSSGSEQRGGALQLLATKYTHRNPLSLPRSLSCGDSPLNGWLAGGWIGWMPSGATPLDSLSLSLSLYMLYFIPTQAPFITKHDPRMMKKKRRNNKHSHSLHFEAIKRINIQMNLILGAG